MRHVTAILLALILMSCSCYEERLSPEEAAKVGVPIGTIITANKELIGMLIENVDDGHNYIVITQLPGFSNRYVLKRIPITAGTAFEIIGFTRPRSPLCSGTNAVLRSKKEFESSGVEAQIDLIEMAVGTFTVNQEMFSVQMPEQGG